MTKIVESLQSLAVPLDTLTLDPANARAHNQRGIEAIAASLAAYGQRTPIVAQKKGDALIVRKGNGTLQAAHQLGWARIACVVVEESDTTATGYAIADNRTAELSAWNANTLADLLTSLDGEDVYTAYSDGDLSALLAEVGVVDDSAKADKEDDSTAAEFAKGEELAIEWGTKTGQIWKIGAHRLMIGDCRDDGDVASLMDGKKINIAFTSPPYAQQREYDKDSGFVGIREEDYTEWFKPVSSNVERHLADDGSWFVNIKEHARDSQRSLYVKELTIAHVRQWGWMFVDEFIWQHTGLPGTWPNRFKNQFEPVFHFSRNKGIKFRPKSVMYESNMAFSYEARELKMSKTSNPISFHGSDITRGKGLALPGNVLRDINKSKANAEHPAMFPEALPAWFLLAFSDKGDVVFDPFLGSGTTVIAAENNGRVCYGMELSPKYAAVALGRMEQMGLKPELING